MLNDNLSLANKMRPKSFQDVVGQETIISILSRQVATKTWKNAYLFAGSHGCVDKDTEYFNGKEWKKISEYTDGDMVLQYNPDTCFGELVLPSAYIKLPCEKLHHIKSKYGIDMCLSDEHTLVYETSKGNLNTIDFKSFREKYVGDNSFAFNNYKIRTTFNYSGKGISLTDSEIKLMCAVICDGYFRSKSTNRCTINIKKERKVEELRNLLKECNIDYIEYLHPTTGYTRFHFNAPRREKEFSEYWYDCDSKQLKIIADNILIWDGSCRKSGRKSFSQNNKKTIDFIQFVFASVGKRTSLSEDNRVGKKYKNGAYTYHSVNYDLTISDNNTVGFSKNRQCLEYVTADGFKYCFTVPTHMWIMRRNGHIAVTGNCGKTSTARIMHNEINNGEGSPIEIDCASNNGVDNIRALIEEAQQCSIDCEYKVFILDEAGNLTKAAWDAALKLIEEPPLNAIFIFCTTAPEKIPSTILSRVQRFDFKRIPTNKIADRLEFIMNEEVCSNYERTALEQIASKADGHMRDAITMLSKCLDCSENITTDVVETSLGLVKFNVLMDIMSGLIQRDAVKCMDSLEHAKKFTTVDMSDVFESIVSLAIDCAIYAETGGIKYTSIPTEYEKLLTRDKELTTFIVDRFIEFRKFMNQSNAESFIKTVIAEVCK